MDTLAAKDQENFVHNLQAAAASKPLNAGLKGFTKTPAKTPFKIPLNDENAFGKGGKSVMQTKGKGNEFMTVKKDGKLDNSAFVTPGPRNRAPLGMKTTNAKGKAFQTPAPPSGSIKTQKASPRLRRPKVKVLQQDDEDTHDDVPDIEYMPPKEVPLPNDMDDYPRDWTIPKLAKGGLWEAYYNPLEHDGRTKLQREFEEGLERDTKKQHEEMDKLMEQELAKDHAEAARYMGVPMPKKAAPKSALKTTSKTIPKASTRPGSAKPTTGPSTLKSRSAAAALSQPRKPLAAMTPSAVPKSRLPSNIISSRKPLTTASTSTSTSRHATATAASKSTIGYAQGRRSPGTATTRKPLSNLTRPAVSTSTFTSRTPSTSTFASTHTRNPSAASSLASRPRAPFSRSSSTSTNATLVGTSRGFDGFNVEGDDENEQPLRTAEDVEREIELMLLRDDDDEDEKWAESFGLGFGAGGGAGEDPFGEGLGLESFELSMPE